MLVAPLRQLLLLVHDLADDVLLVVIEDKPFWHELLTVR
jgi:hypothetical protein